MNIYNEREKYEWNENIKRDYEARRLFKSIEIHRIGLFVRRVFRRAHNRQILCAPVAVALNLFFIPCSERSIRSTLFYALAYSIYSRSLSGASFMHYITM